nr:ABC transporter ATP-binding protein [Curtanaerobium respiraculi]
MKKDEGPARRLLAYAGGRRWLEHVGCLLSAVAMAASIVPYLCIWLIARDLIAVAPDWSAASGIVGYGWAALAFAIAGLALYFAGLTCTHYAAFRTASNMKKACADHLMRAELGYFDTHATGLLRRRIEDAAAGTEQYLAHNLPDLWGSAALFASMVALMLFFDWRMGLSCLIPVAISIACMRTMGGKRHAEDIRAYIAAMETMGKTTTEFIRGIPVLKIFQQTAQGFSSFRKSVEEYSARARRYEGEICLMPQSVNLTFAAASFAFLIPVVVLLAPASPNLGDLTASFFFYAIFSAIISTALARIMFASKGRSVAEQALARFDEVLSAPVLESASAPAQPVEPDRCSIEFDNVSFCYEGADAPALDGVSFLVPARSFTALVGPSGGGKSTLAALVPRLRDVSEGAVRIGGTDVREMEPESLMGLVSIVFQGSGLLKGTLRDNVALARPDATDEQVAEALAGARCADIIEKLPYGLETLVGPDGVHLSGGERQRVLLARALLKDAPILLLDEATAYADPENETLIQAALGELARDRTVLMVAHRLSTVADADRIFVMEDGKVVEAGTHEQLMSSNGVYAGMWRDYVRASEWKMGDEA